MRKCEMCWKSKKDGGRANDESANQNVNKAASKDGPKAN